MEGREGGEAHGVDDKNHNFFSITHLSESVTLNETDSAEFRCTVDAHPFDESTVEWDLPDRNYAGADFSNPFRPKSFRENF
jgi:hypothetical protein